MKKRKKSAQVTHCPLRNPVAKFASQFNKSHVFKDKTKYHRSAKHKNKESFPIILFSLIGKDSLLKKTSDLKKPCFQLMLKINKLHKKHLFCRYLT